MRGIDRCCASWWSSVKKNPPAKRHLIASHIELNWNSETKQKCNTAFILIGFSKTAILFFWLNNFLIDTEWLDNKCLTKCRIFDCLSGCWSHVNVESLLIFCIFTFVLDLIHRFQLSTLPAQWWLWAYLWWWQCWFSNSTTMTPKEGRCPNG